MLHREGPKRFNDAYLENLGRLVAQGIDPDGSDDTVFGVTYVYCGGHLRAHRTGWCTVSNVLKVPLTAGEQEAAERQCRDQGFELYIDRKQG